MKKYFLLFTFFSPLYGAKPLEKPQGLTLEETLNKHSVHRGRQQLKKAGTTGIITAGAYGFSRTGIFQEMFPQLFHRDGTSYVILGTIGIIAGSGGIWVLRDKLEEWSLREKATEDMLQSSKVLKELLPVIKEVQEHQTELESKMDTWGPKIAAALDNSVHARKAISSVEAAVTTIVEDMGDDTTPLSQITVLKDQIESIQATLMKTRKELGDTTALTNETALAHIKSKIETAPPVNELTRMADELEAASNRFQKVPVNNTKKEKKKRWLKF